MGSALRSAIRFDLHGIKHAMKNSTKMLTGTIGLGVLAVLMGEWEAGGKVLEASSVPMETRPAIDRVTPTQTERAVFALG